MNKVMDRVRLRRKYLFSILFTVIALSIVIYVVFQLSISQEISEEEIILNQVDDVKPIVSLIRGLEFPENMGIEVISKRQALEWWAPHELSEEMIYEELVYKLTLLVPIEFNLTAAMGRWTASFIAAAAGYKIYIIKENFYNTSDEERRRTIAHELVHILQYHYFKINYPKEIDADLAIKALIEGDADFTADLYCNKTGIPTREKPIIPIYYPYLALKLFPYIYGEQFVKYIYDNGGWELVNKAYENPPISTEQVMHPDKYLTNEKPKETILSISIEGDVKYRGTMGEYYILVVLASKIEFDKAMKAAEGWGGDILALYRVDEKWVLYWNITWDTSIDAEEFYEAMISSLQYIGNKELLSDNMGVFVVDNIRITVILNDGYTLIKSEYTE